MSTKTLRNTHWTRIWLGNCHISEPHCSSIIQIWPWILANTRRSKRHRRMIFIFFFRNSLLSCLTVLQSMSILLVKWTLLIKACEFCSRCEPSRNWPEHKASSNSPIVQKSMYLRIITNNFLNLYCNKCIFTWLDVYTILGAIIRDSDPLASLAGAAIMVTPSLSKKHFGREWTNARNNISWVAYKNAAETSVRMAFSPGIPLIHHGRGHTCSNTVNFQADVNWI